MQLVEEPRYDCKYLPAEEKEVLKGYFYEVKKRTNPRAHDYLLLQVGDEATIKHFISEFEAVGWQYREAPEHSGQARFIEVYAPTMFREEPFVDTPGDTPGPPLSYAITNSIVRLLRESPQLSAEVRYWALSLPDGELDLPKNRSILRQWWRANKRDFREHNYQTVQPPPRDFRIIPARRHLPALSGHAATRDASFHLLNRTRGRCEELITCRRPHHRPLSHPPRSRLLDQHPTETVRHQVMRTACRGAKSPLTTLGLAPIVPAHSKNRLMKLCEITQAHPHKGSKIHRRGLAKKKGGIGQHVTKVVKRTFEPNLRTKRIWVGELKKFVTVKLTARALKTVTKNGAYATLKTAGVI